MPISIDDRTTRRAGVLVPTPADVTTCRDEVIAG